MKTAFKHLTPVRIAVVLAVVLALWLLVGERKSMLDEPPGEQQKPEATLAKVQVAISRAHPWNKEVIAQGQLEPWHQVAVAAQVTGRVTALNKQQGDAVAAGDVLLEISDEGRSARLKQAQATVALREQELRSAETLQSSRLVAETELQRLRSALALAEADLVSDQLARDYNRPTAPFAGLVNRRYVEPGQLVNPGTALMDIVQVERLKVVAHVPQQDVADLEVGQPVTVEMLDGDTLEGEVLFISYAADPETRAYYFEVETANPQALRAAGASATLRVHLPTVMAHQVSPALLSLNEAGELGVHAVDERDTVRFHPVKVLKIDNDSATLQGLPATVRLITLGAGFVEPGDQVIAVETEVRQGPALVVPDAAAEANP